jgi:hypothetical protein
MSQHLARGSQVRVVGWEAYGQSLFGSGDQGGRTARTASWVSACRNRNSL